MTQEKITSGRKIGNFFVSSALDAQSSQGLEYHVEIKNLTTLPFDIQVISQIPDVKAARFIPKMGSTIKWAADFTSLHNNPLKQKCQVSRLTLDEFRIQVATIRSKRAFWKTWDDEDVVPALEILVKD
ncbi:hypothetical protein [Rhizobium indigoferae]|uniref:Uncharacterized protein n=1 Tax=Rhizobium indigoferae TaxID=158891 RepID=A0ABZ1DQU5_9HYPH|nr:hypothetical protein [Rhizobium indigoferae]NNU57025.1 hypothetical protein [Rhizobium indigoferae]WRW37687.1 hypothetical protein U5G49_007298 [Rhizobium indigoferae]GLR60310.1 hypothetical protein GCM10007919_50380 [Rhizobium indigoferae]